MKKKNPPHPPQRQAEVDPSDVGRGGNDNTYEEAEVHPPARVFDCVGSRE